MSEIFLKDVELDRFVLMRQVEDGNLSQTEAAEKLGISTRQVRRLVKRFRKEGLDGVKSRKKGGQRSFKLEFKQQVIELVITNYHDFGPTFASEKLYECHALKVNKETLRQWMIEQNLWKGRTRKSARIHQSRERRSRFGELIQIDGSHHDWFEGRGPKCCLLVFIDDATGKILALHFSQTETTMGYMRATLDYLEKYGRPLAYYSDKHAIFKTTRENSIDGRFQDTQFQRAMRELRIELILANSSQAKGRVERANQTLQDRLIKEMRLKGISSIEDANAFAPEFINVFNQKFGVEAVNSEDAHLPLRQEKEIVRRILSVQSTRKLSKNLEISFEGKIYQIKTQTTGYRLRHKEVTVHEHVDGSVEILSDSKQLDYQVCIKASKTKHADSKEINGLIDDLVAQVEEEKRDLFLSAVLPTGPTAPAQLSC